MVGNSTGTQPHRAQNCQIPSIHSSGFPHHPHKRYLGNISIADVETVGLADDRSSKTPSVPYLEAVTSLLPGSTKTWGRLWVSQSQGSFCLHLSLDLLPPLQASVSTPKIKTGAGDEALLVECLPSTQEALGWIPSAAEPQVLGAHLNSQNGRGVDRRIRSSKVTLSYTEGVAT